VSDAGFPADHATSPFAALAAQAGGAAPGFAPESPAFDAPASPAEGAAPAFAPGFPAAVAAYQPLQAPDGQPAAFQDEWAERQSAPETAWSQGFAPAVADPVQLAPEVGAPDSAEDAARPTAAEEPAAVAAPAAPEPAPLPALPFPQAPIRSNPWTRGLWVTAIIALAVGAALAALVDLAIIEELGRALAVGGAVGLALAAALGSLNWMRHNPPRN
jgi:hypothetical protein